MIVLFACMHVCYTHVWCSQDVGFPGNRVKDGCKLSRIHWELNPGPQQEQQMLLTTDGVIFPAPNIML